MRRGCQALELSVALNRALVTGVLKPSDVLVRNEVGNLAIERDGVYVGYVDVMFGEVDVFDEYVMMDARLNRVDDVDTATNGGLAMTDQHLPAEG